MVPPAFAGIGAKSDHRAGVEIVAGTHIPVVIGPRIANASREQPTVCKPFGHTSCDFAPWLNKSEKQIKPSGEEHDSASWKLLSL
jgi:hypothetical protein